MIKLNEILIQIGIEEVKKKATYEISDHSIDLMFR